MKKRSTKTGVLVSIAFVLCILMGVLMLNAQAQTSSGDESTRLSSSVYTDDILTKADIKVGDDDRVIRTDSQGCVALTIMRAFEVEVEFRGESFAVSITSGTVEDAVRKAGITLTGAEEVTPPVDTELCAGMVITVKADCAVSVTADGNTDTYSTASGTVGELLDDLGIELSDDDTVNVELSDMLYDGIEIVVKRVEYKEETTAEIIDYDFITEETLSMDKGTSMIKQYGIEGEKTIVSRNKYIDGELVETVVISEKVTQEPQDQIKLVGTATPKVVSQTPSSSGSSNSSGGASVSSSSGTFVDSSGNTVSYKKKLTGTGTAYYSSPGAMTATGVPAYQGGVAVNPNVIPYGSKLYIVSSDGSFVYGYATAVDTGGALMSGTVLVDVYYPTYAQCAAFGLRNVTVYIL